MVVYFVDATANAQLMTLSNLGILFVKYNFKPLIN